MDKLSPLVPPVRPEFEHKEIAAGNIGEVQRDLGMFERIRNNNFARKAFILENGMEWQGYNLCY